MGPILVMVLGIIYVASVDKSYTSTKKWRMMSNLRPPVKTHGGKWYLRKWIIDRFPKNYQDLRYCELCCGGATIFLNKEPSTEEIINDIDKGTISILRALRDEPKEFIDRLKRIKYTERTFVIARNRSETFFEDYVDKAVNEYVLRRMSRGGMKKTFAWSDRERGGKPGDVNAWNTMLKQLPAIVDRIKATVILNKKFQEIFKVYDETDTFFYFDPPYLPDTRSNGSKDVYEHEMSVEDHIDLLTFIRDARSKIMISGYTSSLYNKYLKGWKTAKKELANHSGQGKSKDRRIECLWWNY